MAHDLYDDSFHFELPVWVLVHKDCMVVGDDGRERIRLPGRLEGSTAADGGQFVTVYSDEDLARQALAEATSSEVVAAAILEHEGFKAFLEFVVSAGIPRIGIDAGPKKVWLLEIESLLKEMD